MKIICTHSFHKDIVFSGAIGTAVDTRYWRSVTINYEDGEAPIRNADGNFYNINYPDNIDFGTSVWSSGEWNTDFDEKVEKRFFRFLDNITPTQLGFDEDDLAKIHKKFGISIVSETYYIAKTKDFSEIEIS